MSRALIIVRGEADRKRAAGWATKAPPGCRIVRPIRVADGVGYVSLTQGFEAIIDAADVPLIEGFNWSVLRSPRRKAVYAARVVRDGNRQRMILMHRVIAAASDDAQVDHRDGDGLNNRRGNLRLCTHAENQRNRGARADNKSGFKGVCFSKRTNRWRAEICAAGQRRFLGYFAELDDARRAYAAAAAALHGEFGRAAP